MTIAQEEEILDFVLVEKQTFLEFVPCPISGLRRCQSESAACELLCSQHPEPETMEPMLGGYLHLQAGALSIGSERHASGDCRPCAWFWKPGGCMNGASCRHCHACPVGELHQRKKKNRAAARRLRRAARAAEVLCESSSGGSQGRAGNFECDDSCSESSNCAQYTGTPRMVDRPSSKSSLSKKTTLDSVQGGLDGFEDPDDES
mmetsp:Transcript_1302/g.3039  ORF Transcript_1302/g.3039 Transcript_1302/m.3039 type:complete len:204 (+) Transcript_1302:71-682(+)|eukprot:CAMPEP_0181412356 /NCGR_PEP_ID=MMETSP1110-20121109/8376_1 /TAXON_ID=174948 /ORGANISM="Symbiodinium sp., Strain CCMP421" /LENGTH=203 /DNA_ID=CAMNT_0023535059 /DNA_START=55 /DNA_END=666 /DNA_ORIENTATION=-